MWFYRMLTNTKTWPGIKTLCKREYMWNTTVIFAGKRPKKILLTNYYSNCFPVYANRIVMGMDMARNTYWKSYGGKPGLAFLLTTFKNDLEKMGLVNYYDQLFFTNPQQLYSFTKKNKKPPCRKSPFAQQLSAAIHFPGGLSLPRKT